MPHDFTHINKYCATIAILVFLNLLMAGYIFVYDFMPYIKEFVTQSCPFSM